MIKFFKDYIDEKETDETEGITSTGQSTLAYRLAAILFLINIISNIYIFLTLRSDILLTTPTFLFFTLSIIPVVIDLIISIGLLKLNYIARGFALIRVAGGAIIWPIIYFSNYGFSLILLIITIFQLGFTGAIFLLLTGKSQKLRIIIAIGIYIVFTFLPLVLIFLMAALLVK